MTVDRVPCTNPRCSQTVLTSTAARTRGLCTPCAQEEAAREREEYARDHRTDRNVFGGVTDPVEILRLSHEKREPDPLVNWIPHPTPLDQLYNELSDEDAARVVELAASYVGTPRHREGEQIMRCLAAYTAADLQPCQKALLAAGVAWPPIAFIGAIGSVRDKLINLIEGGSRYGDHVMRALAWVGDEEVVDRFHTWSEDPPDWARGLRVLSKYPREAGWELVEGGGRRDLFSTKAWGLVNGGEAGMGVTAVRERSEFCPWCGSKLLDFLKFPRVLIGQEGVENGTEDLHVVSCETCTAFGTVYCILDENGDAQWSPDSKLPQYLPDDLRMWRHLPREAIGLGAERGALAAADQNMPVAFSQIGGHPTWIQNARYPSCRDCRRSMKFIAQIDRSDFYEGTEGIYYLFHCDLCRTGATGYQQS